MNPQGHVAISVGMFLTRSRPLNIYFKARLNLNNYKQWDGICITMSANFECYCSVYVIVKILAQVIHIPSYC